MSNPRLRDWNANLPKDQGETEGEVDATDIFLQLDCVHDERRERHDPTWWPPGRDPENLERLVEDRRARGVLRSPRTRER